MTVNPSTATESNEGNTELRILGPVEAVVDNRVVPLGGGRNSSLLAVLALEPDQVVPISRLIEAIWEDEPPATARSQVQICVSGLRRSLLRHGRNGVILTRPPGYVLSSRRVTVDAQVFERQTARARQLTAQGQPGRAAETLRDALALWRGPALLGLTGRVVEGGALRLNERRQVAVEERLRLDLALDRHAEIVGELLALVTEHPLREELYALLMLALYRSGRQAEALDVYRRARAALVDQLGIEPGEQLRELERAILSGRVPPPSARVPLGNQRHNLHGGVPLSAVRMPALGNDPVLGGGRPPAPGDLARQAQPQPDPVGAGTDPPTISRLPTLVPRQLPACVADFTGREEQLRQVRELLLGAKEPVAAAAPSVVVICGQGGVGKSAFAVHVAHAVREHFPDGQLYANLSGSTGPHNVRDVLTRLLRSLGVPGNALAGDVDELTELYRDHTAGRRILLVLEGVTAEAQVPRLLPADAGCAVLVTARRRLTGLPGAHLVTLDVLGTDAAVALLAAIAGPARLAAEPAAGAELAQLCDGLPLALRIVGARLAASPYRRLEHLLRRLRDETRRLDEMEHGGLGVRASLTLSYAGLSPAARRLLRRLSRLAAPDFGSWVGAALLELPPDEVEDHFDELVSAYLLEVAEERTGLLRYRLHNLVRVFAQERAAAEEAPAVLGMAVRRALAGWLALAEEAHRREYGGDYTILHGSEPRWPLPAGLTGRLLENPMAWLDAERAAIVCSFRQAISLGLTELGWDLALTAVTLFEAKGYFADWRETAELALAATRNAGNRRGNAAMRYALGSLALVEQRYPAAAVLLAEAYSAFEAESDRHGRALVLRNQAFLDRVQGDTGRALGRYGAALGELRAVGDQIAVAHVLASMAAIQLDAGDHRQARKLLDEALDICEITASRRVGAQVLFRLGEAYLHGDELDRSSQAFHRVLRMARDGGDRIGEAYALLGLGTVRHREGRLAQAEAALRQAVEVAHGIGERMVEAQAQHGLGEVELDRAEFDPAKERFAAAQRIFHDIGATAARARALSRLGHAYARQGDLRMAQRLADDAASLLPDQPTARVLDADAAARQADPDAAWLPYSPAVRPRDPGGGVGWAAPPAGESAAPG